jgi:hypothetical protein
MRAPMRRFISSSFFSLSSKVEGSMLGNNLRATCGAHEREAGEIGGRDGHRFCLEGGRAACGSPRQAARP